MDDAFLVRVLDGATHVDEEPQPLRQRSRCASQYSVIGSPRTSSIAKYGSPVSVSPGMQHFGDSGVIHQRQRLAPRREASRRPRARTGRRERP